MFLGHSLMIIKWTWGVFSKKVGIWPSPTITHESVTFFRIMLPNDFIMLWYITMSLKLPSPKNVISENIVSDVPLKNFFISWKSYPSFSRYSMFCISNHSAICNICDAMTSTSTLERIHFVTCLLYHKSSGHKTLPTSR